MNNKILVIYYKHYQRSTSLKYIVFAPALSFELLGYVFVNKFICFDMLLKYITGISHIFRLEYCYLFAHRLHCNLLRQYL